MRKMRYFKYSFYETHLQDGEYTDEFEHEFLVEAPDELEANRLINEKADKWLSKSYRLEGFIFGNNSYLRLQVGDRVETTIEEFTKEIFQDRFIRYAKPRTQQSIVKDAVRTCIEKNIGGIDEPKVIQLVEEITGAIFESCSVSLKDEDRRAA